MTTLRPEIALRRACSAMSADGGFRQWLDGRFGAGRWVHSEYPRDGFDTAISNHDLADLAVEYGRQRLTQIFAIPPCPVPLPK